MSKLHERECELSSYQILYYLGVAMLKFPFISRTDANKAAWLMWKAFTYHSVQMMRPGKSNPTDIPLYQTKQYLAAGFGFLNWNQVIQHVKTNKGVPLAGEKDYVALAMNIERFMGVNGQFEQICRALRTACIWDASDSKEFMTAFFKKLPCKTIEQWGELQQIDAICRYHTRYNRGRSDKEIAKLVKWRNEAQARVLNPPKPR